MCLLLLLDQSREKSKKDPGDSFRVLVHKAASAASKLAKHAYESASANKRMDDELVPLKCCLMSVSLPWDYIAHDLLHKVSFSILLNNLKFSYFFFVLYYMVDELNLKLYTTKFVSRNADLYA